MFSHPIDGPILHLSGLGRPILRRKVVSLGCRPAWLISYLVEHQRIMEAAQKPFRGPWIIATCFLTFGLSTGFPYYNSAFFFDYFRDHHGWTIEVVTMGAPLAVLLTIWAGPFSCPASARDC